MNHEADCFDDKYSDSCLDKDRKSLTNVVIVIDTIVVNSKIESRILSCWLIKVRVNVLKFQTQDSYPRTTPNQT